ncbi:MAG: hypothetical protein KDC98_25410 [Planctomycetes bacterium]|nr:hypothetical protein [Planctomycetota bacterium]
MKIIAPIVCVAALFTCCQNSAPVKPDEAMTSAVEAAAAGSYDRPGFIAIEKEGRLTVFCAESEDLASFRKSGDLIKCVTRIGAGPNGMTVRAPDAETIDGYALSRPGFAARVSDGRIWVFAAGSKDFATYCSVGEPAKCVTLIGAGPGGETVKSSDAAVIEAWKKAL